MFSLSNSEFGQAINYQNWREKSKDKKEKKNKMGGNAMISQFLKVKKQYRKPLEDLTQGDPHARRYFCLDDCAYIFDYKIMRALVDVIESKYKGKDLSQIEGGIFLFQGLKKSLPKKTKAEKTENGRCSFGRPTIIAAAYIYDPKTKKYIHQRIPGNLINRNTASVDDELYDGFEHPGNGNSGEPPTSPIPATGSEKKEEFPVVVDPTDGEYDESDFAIKTEISIPALKKWST